ncbi:MAG: hypothetical protein PHN42_03930 [Bacilli bacterium]|nr:hypothetical protein [Bacilli bacterium]
MKKKYKFLLFAILLIVLKQILINNLPIYAIGNSSCDDQLMIMMEANLLKLNWLGDFNSLTLVKGIFFPFFLAVNAFLGISYINGITLFYSIACLIFVYSIRKIFHKEWPIYLIFLLLLFNPIMFSLETAQRVYRNSLTPGQVLLIMASIFAMFINRKNNKNILWWSIFGGISLATFWNTREDAIWILPFILVFTMIMIVEHIVTNKNKFQLKKIIIFILPLIILQTFNIGISTINYMKYGVFTRVDLSNTNFSEAIEAIYSVPTYDNIEYTSVTKEKLERLYDISPSLNSISEELNAISISMDQNGRIPSDEQIEDGWFWWALRFAAEAKGYYENAIKAENFFGDIVNEIETAQKNGLIEKQSTMPSALMSPWREGYLKKLFNTSLEIIKYTNNYTDVNAIAMESVGSYNSIKFFEIATNDTAIYPAQLSNIEGWYRYNYEDYYIIANVNNEALKRINCKKQENCEINIDFNISQSDETISLKIFNINDSLIKQINIVDDITSEIGDNYSYNINLSKITDPNMLQKEFLNVYVGRLNIIGLLYKKTGIICGIIGLVSYIGVTIIALFKNKKIIDKWLILSSILATYLVLCIGVSYNHISSCHSISSMYLSAAYSLIIIFWSMSIFVLIDYIKEKKLNN